MKIAKKSNRKKIIIIIVAVLLVGGVATYGLFQTQQNSAQNTGGARPMNDVDYSPATEEEKESVDQRKDEIIKEQEQNEQLPTTEQSISLTVTRASQGGASQPLNIRTLVHGTNSGTCEVTLTKDGQPTLSKNFSVVFEATSATCGSADIPASDFGATGEWKLNIIVKKDAQVSNTIEQTVTINK